MCAYCDRRARRQAKIIAELMAGVTTASRIARRLRVSTRTVYREIQLLRELGQPIIGEAGAGYLLRQREARHVGG